MKTKPNFTKRFNWKDLGVGIIAFPPASYGLIKFLKPEIAAAFIGISVAILYGMATSYNDKDTEVEEP